MLRDNWGWPVAAIVFAGMMGVGIYFAEQKKYQCDQLVFLEGELGMDCCDVTSGENGMSRILLCDSTLIQVPTNRIIKIVDK